MATDDLPTTLRAVVEAWRIRWWPPLADDSDWACWNFDDLVARLVAVVEERERDLDAQAHEGNPALLGRWLGLEIGARQRAEAERDALQRRWDELGEKFDEADVEVSDLLDTMDRDQLIKRVVRERNAARKEVQEARQSTNALRWELRDARALAWETGERLAEANAQLDSLDDYHVALRARLARVEGALRQVRQLANDEKDFTLFALADDALAEDAGVGQGTSPEPRRPAMKCVPCTHQREFGGTEHEYDYVPMGEPSDGE